MLHEQNIFKMGGLFGKMKLTGWTFIIGALALAGVFPFRRLLVQGCDSRGSVSRQSAVVLDRSLDGVL